MWKEKWQRQPICMSKPAYNFFNHTFTSFSSTGQKVLQTCPSLTKLLPYCDSIWDLGLDLILNVISSKQLNGIEHWEPTAFLAFDQVETFDRIEAGQRGMLKLSEPLVHYPGYHLFHIPIHCIVAVILNCKQLSIYYGIKCQCPHPLFDVVWSVLIHEERLALTCQVM